VIFAPFFGAPDDRAVDQRHRAGRTPEPRRRLGPID
jgi:hypothetical protein